MPLALEMKNVRLSFKDQDILEMEHLTVYEGEKIGIIGANGQGKSTLLQLIAGQIKPDYGRVERYIDIEYLRQVGGEARGALDYEWLSRMQVPAQAYENLSGGQQRKFMLSQVLAHYPQGLLLDEPTTHLDKESIEELVKEIQYYYGTVLIVSHDRSFLNATVQKIWEVAEGQVTVYSGNYQSYVEEKEKAKRETTRYNEKLAKEKVLLERAITSSQTQLS